MSENQTRKSFEQVLLDGPLVINVQEALRYMQDNFDKVDEFGNISKYAILSSPIGYILLEIGVGAEIERTESGDFRYINFKAYPIKRLTPNVDNILAQDDIILSDIVKNDGMLFLGDHAVATLNTSVEDIVIGPIMMIVPSCDSEYADSGLREYLVNVAKCFFNNNKLLHAGLRSMFLVKEPLSKYPLLNEHFQSIEDKPNILEYAKHLLDMGNKAYRQQYKEYYDRNIRFVSHIIDGASHQIGGCYEMLTDTSSVDILNTKMCDLEPSQYIQVGTAENGVMRIDSLIQTEPKKDEL